MANGLDLGSLIQAAQLGRSLNPAVMQQQALGNQLAQQLQQLQIAKLLRDQEDFNNPGAANFRALQAQLSGETRNPLSPTVRLSPEEAAITTPIAVPSMGTATEADLLAQEAAAQQAGTQFNVPRGTFADPIVPILSETGQPTGFADDLSKLIAGVGRQRQIQNIINPPRPGVYKPGDFIATDEQLAAGTGFTVPDRAVAPKIDVQKVGNTIIRYQNGVEIGRETIPPGEELFTTPAGAFVGKPNDVNSFKLIPGTGPSAGGAPNEAYAQQRVERNLQSVAELRDAVSPFTTGLGSLLSLIPGTEATDFLENVNTLKANIAFSELQAMRAASKTGGALGQVAVKELELLQSALGALNPRQSAKSFLSNLNKIEQSMLRFRTAQSEFGASQQAPVSGKKTLSSKTNFPTEEAARAAGFGNGSVVIINGVTGTLN